jgi:hypothetical protein
MAPIYKIEEANKSFIFHWVVLMLGSLKDIDLTRKIDICFDREDFNSYQKESFDLLSDVINVVPNTCNWTLLSSVKPLDYTNNSEKPLVDHSVYHFLRKLFLSRVDNTFDTSDYDKIYICRGRSHLCEGNREDNNIRRRQIVNEDEVVESLKDIGIKSIFFEDYTMSEKIQIMNNASLVVAPQSGGLTFTLFANHNTDIVEIYPPNPHQYCDQYIDVCRALNIPFKRFTEVEKVDIYDNMLVDTEKLIKFIITK